MRNQLNDVKINLENTQRIIAEKIVVAGKVPQLERDNEDLKIKIKRYEENSHKLLEELNSLTTERNKLLNKVDDLMKNPQVSAIGNKKALSKGRSGLLGIEGMSSSNVATGKIFF